MRSVFSSLVAASLLIHAALGCCWHHEHESLSCCDESPAAEVADVACCHHDHGDQHQGQPTHAPCDGHSQCQGVCTYLPVQKTQLDKSQLDVAMDFAAITPATCDAQVAAEACLSRTHDLAPKPPLRLHLLHQILLI